MIRTTFLRPSALIAPLLALGIAAACSPITTTRGNLTDADRVAQIKAGSSRMEDVQGLLGSPSHIGTFDQTVWYYIGEKAEKTAFLTPDIVERRVVVVQFDPQGVVTNVQRIDGADSGQEVELVDRTTPTTGRELTFVEQLLGSVGRFSGKSTQSGVLRTPGL